MPDESKRKLLGMPRSSRGDKYLLIKTTQANTFLVQKLKKPKSSKKK